MRLIKLWEADLEKAYKLQNSFKQDENGFINAAYGYTLEQFAEYVELCQSYSKGEKLPEGYVQDTRFVLEDEDGDYTGIFNLRHCLNEFLAKGPGHIGYGIAPEYRKKGYATQGLAIVLEEAGKLGIEEVYLSANRDNVGSVKAQLNNGAVIYKETEEKIYTRIEL